MISLRWRAFPLAAIFLNAILMRFLYDKILLRPFATIPERLGQSTATLENQGQQLKLGPLLQQLAGLFKKNEKYAGVDWISHTLQMIYPSRTEPDGQETASELQKFYEDTAAEFCNGPMAFLFEKPEDSENMIKDLISLLKKADALRVDIWKGRVDIRLHLLGSIKLGEVFQPGSDIMKPHCTMLPTTATGSRLLMVVEPAVIAYWVNNQGEEKSKVWSKAIVWAGDSRIKIWIKTQMVSRPKI